MLLEIKQLNLQRGGVTICENISFSCAPGQLIWLKGANGAGKTTLIRTLAGLCNSKKAYIPGAQYLGLKPAMNDSMTLEQNLLYWQSKKNKCQIEKVLEQLNLSQYKNTIFARLSAGQQKRAAFGRLLLSSALCWLLDEPFLSLDRTSVNIIKDLMLVQLEKNGCIILSSHIELPAQLTARATEVNLENYL